MKLSISILTLLPFLLAATHVAALVKRAETTNGWDLNKKTYDYVVVGGGTAGLVVATRLAEANKTVAVIEAGATGYDDNQKFITPAADLYDSSVNTQYDWNWKLTPQHQLLDQNGNRGRRPSWPRGKVLGGSSAINGLYYVRNSEVEQNTMARLTGDTKTWGWDNLLRAMKKSENFSPPLSSVRDQAHISYESSSHGHNGPIHTTWPAVTYPPVGAFMQAANKVLASINKDPYNGKSWGTYVSLATINRHNKWTRSFSRSDYLEPNANNANLHVLTGHQVTRVNFDRSNSKSVRATGVQYAAGSGAARQNVHARHEVILSGGTINDPQILQLSGIGDSSLLKKHGIDVVVDLPGVGQNLQDHLSAGMSFKPKRKSDAGQTSLTGNAKTDSFVNTAVSYVDFGKLFKNPGGYVNKLQSNISSVINSANVPSEVKAGYKRTYKAQVNDIFTSKVGPVEILFNVMFGNINIQAALQHPLSRGTIKIRSKDPFQAPAIDANYLDHNSDLTILRQAFKLIRKVAQESPLSDHIDYETNPGKSVQSNADWEKWIRQNGNTEYHPSCTCSMLPRNQGGVVDSDLKVYGTSNLRVIDASVPPLSVSAHLMSVTYGIAEIGAELILSSGN